MKLDITKRHLRLVFIIATAVALLAAVLISTAAEFVLTRTGIISQERLDKSWLLIGAIFCGVSAIIGLFLAYLASKFIFRPVDTFLDGMGKLADGRYDTRLDFGKNVAFHDLSVSFNSMAHELENTEILRSNFINNFSHEFKTPIVSIKGLVSLMKNSDISSEKRTEYLNIIEEELDHLSMMTTNVLNLSKIENQTILVDKHTYNVSEQVRTCVLLFERRWTEKNLVLQLDFEEYNVCASEELMKHVFVNLIDNAIKFSSQGAQLLIGIVEKDGNIEISIGNSGEPIGEEEREKIFSKFYQADKSNAKSGNGIGLSIVKSVVDLHHGTVRLTCEGGVNTFTVTLPEK